MNFSMQATYALPAAANTFALKARRVYPILTPHSLSKEM